MLHIYLVTAIMIMAVFFTLELWAKQQESESEITSYTVHELMIKLPEMFISERELDNQMLMHNVALFSRHPSPESVITGYVGTSRTKVLRPEHFGLVATVVGAGNSYNEITFGLLLQAEILRLQFPNLRKVYFETSMLLRRPSRLILEKDHVKYIPLLRSLEAICLDLPKLVQCRQVISAVNSLEDGKNKKWHSALLNQRGRIRLARLFEEKKGVYAFDSPLMEGLQSNGERKTLSVALLSENDWKPRITKEHVKVQRLRDIMSNSPWDGLFDMIAGWGKAYNIEVVFFQPPVRSDLYVFQKEYGLKNHLIDLERVSLSYNIPFINLNDPELGYMDNWTLFSDEDHMETCIGSGLFTLALEEGYKKYKDGHKVYPKINLHTLQEKYIEQLKICN